MRPNINLEHGNYGEPSRCQLTVDRGLKSGKLDTFDLTEDDVLLLLAEAAACLKIMRGLR